MTKKTIIILGPESSGSRLVAKTIALWEQIVKHIDDWDGTLKCEGEKTTIIHRSIPSGPDKYIVDILEFKNKYPDLKIVFTTRDKNISQKSRNNSDIEHLKWIEANRKAIETTRKYKIPYLIFSYETLLLYRNLYWIELFNFIKPISLSFPILIDGNKKYLK